MGVFWAICGGARRVCVCLLLKNEWGSLGKLQLYFSDNSIVNLPDFNGIKCFELRVEREIQNEEKERERERL